jgi:hypothetical protein
MSYQDLQYQTDIIHLKMANWAEICSVAAVADVLQRPAVPNRYCTPEDGQLGRNV